MGFSLFLRKAFIKGADDQQSNAWTGVSNREPPNDLFLSSRINLHLDRSPMTRTPDRTRHIQKVKGNSPI
jgi:hypothetical protein